MKVLRLTERPRETFSLLPIGRSPGPVQVVRMELGPGGVVPGHPAATAQLFVCVAGSGWARTETEQTRLEPGDAVLWEAGEWHESGSETGMTAVVLEADELSPGPSVDR